MRVLLPFVFLCWLPIAAVQAQTWELIAPMPTPRTAAAVAVLDGQIYVIGGRNAAGMALGVVERYNPATDEWATVGALRRPRFNAAAVTLGGQILLIGGREFDDSDNELEVTDDVEVYNRQQNRWESFEDLEDEREGLAAVNISGTVYAIGGVDSLQVFLNDAEAYDDAEDEWNPYPFWTLATPRAAFAAVPEGDGALVFGGFSAVGPLALVERYRPGENGSTSLAPLPEPRGALAGTATASGLVYAMGGRNAAGVVVDRVDIYNPIADEWDPETALPEPREGAVAASVDLFVYIFGGNTETGALVTTSRRLMVTTTLEPEVPDSGGLALDLVGPNPFREQTALSLTLDHAEAVEVAVYDLLGRQVAVLHDGFLVAGTHRLVWDGRGDGQYTLASGTYLIRARMAGLSTTLPVTRVP